MGSRITMNVYKDQYSSMVETFWLPVSCMLANLGGSFASVEIVGKHFL